MTSERDGLKAKLKKTELDLEQIKTENQGFREERDRLRKRVGTLVCCTSKHDVLLVTGRKSHSSFSSRLRRSLVGSAAKTLFRVRLQYR